MKSSILQIAFIALLLATGCHPTQTITSTKSSTPENINFRYYDAESKMRYKVANDETNVYITLNTAEPTSVLKIMHTGLWVYFDLEGKKKRNMYLQYPLVEVPDEAELAREEFGPADPYAKPLKKRISELPFEALFFHNGKEEFVSALTGETKIILSAQSDQELTYHIQVPIAKIFPNGYSPESVLSIGIISGGIEAPTQRKTRPDNGMPGSQMPGANAGMPGQNGAMSGSMSGPGAGNVNFSDLQVPIEFWFKLILTK